MKRILTKIYLCSLIAAPISAQAQFAKVDDAVQYRQAAFQVMSTHIKRIGAAVKSDMPFDKSAVEANIAIIEMLSKQLWTAFPAGSDTPHSKSKPEIWKEMDKFKASANDLQVDVSKLSVAAKSGDLNAVRSAFGSVTQSCKSCHDNFRTR